MTNSPHALDASYVLSALPRLNKGELEEVKRRTTALLQMGRRTDPQPIEDEDWLLLGILSELRHRGLDNRPTVRLKKASSYAGFSAQSERVRQLLLDAAPGLTAVQRRALGEIAARALADYLTWTDLNRDTLMRFVGRVPEALDKAYPGYTSSGLLPLIIGGTIRARSVE